MSDGQDRPTLKAGRSPNYCLTEAIEDIPQGAFIRPIEFFYIPKESYARLNLDPNSFNTEKFVVCYTAKGLRVIPRAIIKER